MKLSKSALKRLFSDLLRKRLTDSMFATLIDSLWRDYGSGVGGTPITFADTDDVDFTIDGSEVSAVTIGYTGLLYDAVGTEIPIFNSEGNKLTVSNGLIKIIPPPTYTLTVNNGTIEA